MSPKKPRVGEREKRPDHAAIVAMSAVETAAAAHAHVLGPWYGVGTRLYARESERIWLTECTCCHQMGWIVRPRFELWRPGGRVLEEQCLWPATTVVDSP